jgi:hypothetical protein
MLWTMLWSTIIKFRPNLCFNLNLNICIFHL